VDGNQRVRSFGEESLYSLDFVKRLKSISINFFMSKLVIIFYWHVSQGKVRNRKMKCALIARKLSVKEMLDSEKML